MLRQLYRSRSFLVVTMMGWSACLGSACLWGSERQLTFESDVRPILKAACFHCHGESDEREGGLDVRLARFLESGGDSGAAVVPGRADESLLWQRVDDGEMPPDPSHRLSEQQINTIRNWIDGGAGTQNPEPDSLDSMLITDSERSHWSFQPIIKSPVPRVDDETKVRTPIDAFVLSKLEEHGFTFSAAADPNRLLRRITIDLHGLPPSPEQVDRFVGESDPRAYEKWLDRLLASPRYGERWGRHWLDVAGYADSEGYNLADAKRSHAWRYRDYVLDAWNEDRPFDRFVVEQLAGDELVTSPHDNLTPQDAELLIATGFLRMAPDGTGGAVDDASVARNTVIAGTMKIVSSSLLGMTVDCAQCHDHRYDPIPQSDYYRLRAVFDPALDWKSWRSPGQRLISLYTDRDREQAAAVEAEAKKIDDERTQKQAAAIARTLAKQIEKLPEAIRAAASEAKETPAEKRTEAQKRLIKENPSLNVTSGSLYLYDRKASDELKAMSAEAAAVRAKKPPEHRVRAMTERPGKIPESFLFARGDHGQPKQSVEPAGLTVVSMNAPLPEIPNNDSSLATSGRRLALAARLTDRQHPLVARVIVNRIWMHHFGRGIVTTPADFGVLGALPTHPELLDWLAAEFVDSGWSVKHMHRLIMRSSVYRQALRVDPVQRDVDPENRLYGGAPLRRLDAESFRDAILAVSGRLNRQSGGPPVPVMADDVGRWVLGIENIKNGRVTSVIGLAGQDSRRSVYVEARRSRPLSVLASFDWPTMTPNCERRRDSTVATQSLMLMNSDLIVRCAATLAERITADVAAQDVAGQDVAGQDVAGQDVAGQDGARIDRLWKVVYGRAPSAEERASAERFVADQRQRVEGQGQALAVLCQMLLCSNEFLYVD